jgi:hypothetical protein
MWIPPNIHAPSANRDNEDGFKFRKKKKGGSKHLKVLANPIKGWTVKLKKLK